LHDDYICMSARLCDHLGTPLCSTPLGPLLCDPKPRWLLLSPLMPLKWVMLY
jgi:hypothetical protein